MNEQGTASRASTAGPGTRGALIAAAISGLLYTAFAFVPQVDGPPVETASADQIRAFLAEHDTGIRVLAAAVVLAIPLVLILTVSLARMIRDRAPGSPLADLVVGGGVLLAVWHWVVVAGTSTTLVQALDGTDLASVDDATLRGWYGLSNLAHIFADLGVVAMAVVMAATSVAALRTGIFARWFGWLGLALAAGGVIGAVGVMVAWEPLADVWFTGGFGWWLWTLMVAVTCGLRLRRAVGAVDGGPAPSPAA